MRSGAIDPKADIPEMDVTFTNGVTKKIILRHYNAIPSSESADHSRFCNYLGHVEGDETNSVIAVTGCLMGDEPDEMMHITLLSQHSPIHKSFSLDKNGITKHIEIQNIVESRNSTKEMPLQDHVLFDEQKEKAAAKVSRAQRREVPAMLSIKIRLGYDTSTYDHFGGDEGKVDNWLAEVMTHSQAHFLHGSLRHKIILEVVFND